MARTKREQKSKQQTNNKSNAIKIKSNQRHTKSKQINTKSKDSKHTKHTKTNNDILRNEHEEDVNEAIISVLRSSNIGKKKLIQIVECAGIELNVNSKLEEIRGIDISESTMDINNNSTDKCMNDMFDSGMIADDDDGCLPEHIFRLVCKEAMDLAKGGIGGQYTLFYNDTNKHVHQPSRMHVHQISSPIINHSMHGKRKKRKPSSLMNLSFTAHKKTRKRPMSALVSRSNFNRKRKFEMSSFSRMYAPKRKKIKRLKDENPRRIE